MNKEFQAHQLSSPKMGNSIFEDNKFPVNIFPQVSNIYNLNINGPIEDLDQIQDCLTAMRIAEEHDQIIMNINSPGGSLEVTDSLLMAMAKCKAPIFASASGLVASAVTLLIMAVDAFEVSPFTNFLFHSASWGSYGKQHDVISEAQFFGKQCEEMMRYHYAGFFTSEEVDDIILNKREKWLNADEFMERMEKRMAYLEDQYKKSKEPKEEQPEPQEAVQKPKRTRNKKEPEKLNG